MLKASAIKSVTIYNCNDIRIHPCTIWLVPYISARD